MKFVSIAALAIALTGCTSYPDSYPPPLQRAPITDETALGFRSFMTMNAPGAEGNFIQDVRPLEGGAWRWTGRRPTLRFVLNEVEDLKFVMDFSVAGATFDTTGPVTITFSINGKALETVSYTSFGEKHFERAVDPSWLEAGQDTIIAADISPVWVSPQDGTELGIILLQAGFVK